MVGLTENERKKCDTNEELIKLIETKYEKKEVKDEDYEEKLQKTIKERYFNEENDVDEKEIKSEIQYVFSMRLRGLLEEKEIQENEFAEILDVAKGTVSKYISGKMFPSLATLAKICRNLNVSIEYLLGLSHIPVSFVWNIDDTELPVVKLCSDFIADDEFLELLKKSYCYTEFKRRERKLEELPYVEKEIQMITLRILNRIVVSRGGKG